MFTSYDFCAGMDISHDQGNLLNRLNPGQDNLTFVFIKASGGHTIQDRNFNANWRLAQEKGLLRGPYHFFYTGDTAAQQMENFTSMIKTLESNDLPPVLDIEERSFDTENSVVGFQRQILELLERMQAHFNRTPIIYTNLDVGRRYLDAEQFANYPLWIADPRTRSFPPVPPAWSHTGWKFWQYGTRNIAGIRTDVDYFPGTRSELIEFIANSYTRRPDFVV
ncbi:MAG: GH25 family lysozyme [Bacteroidota bacterium]